VNRRALLALLAGAALDPERLLWLPGRKIISIPPARTVARISGPFGVFAQTDGSSDAAMVLQRLMNHRWATDSAWRQHAEELIARRMEQVLLGEIQQGIGWEQVRSR